MTSLPARQRFKDNERAGIVIIGGGVVGLTIGRALAHRGIREIVIVEKGTPGQEASWAAGGILAPQVEAAARDDFFQLAATSRDRYPEFARDLHAESGIDVELDTSGTLYVAFAEEEEIELRRRFRWQQSEDLQVAWLSGGEARELEPCLSDKVRCALRFPDDYQVNNRKLIEALHFANEACGVRIVDHCPVESVRIADGAVRGVETARGPIAAEWVVLAAGAWSSTIAPGNSLPAVRVEPVRGQMLVFAPPSHFAQHVVYSARGYLIPRRDGRVIAGSTTEAAGFQKVVTEEGVQAIKSMARQIAPAIEALPVIDSWAGLRPRAQDGLPVLGPTRAVKGLIYATGHYRNGILLAPITGELIAEAIAAPSSSQIDVAFSPDRFSR